jgi:hypothetical protein
MKQHQHVIAVWFVFEGLVHLHVFPVLPVYFISTLLLTLPLVPACVLLHSSLQPLVPVFLCTVLLHSSLHPLVPVCFQIYTLYIPTNSCVHLHLHKPPLVPKYFHTPPYTPLQEFLCAFKPTYNPTSSCVHLHLHKPPLVSLYFYTSIYPH